MSKSQNAEHLLDELSSLRGQAVTNEARAQVSKALASRVSFVAAKAADVARELKIQGLCSELRHAFDRFLNDPKLPDKGCAAKTAIARAALELECTDEAIFRAGIRHVQMEPSYGGPRDAAGELRGLCGLGLVQARSRDAMNCLVELLNDGQTQARVGAVRALAYSGREEAVLLLRFKAISGDHEAAVVGECLTALLSLQPREAVEFVGTFLDSPLGSVREEAALALGTSKQPAALELLERHFNATADRRFRQTLLTSIAGLRFPSAVDFLVSLLETAEPSVAADALIAARLFRHDATIRERIARAIARRDETSLKSEFDMQFGS